MQTAEQPALTLCTSSARGAPLPKLCVAVTLEVGLKRLWMCRSSSRSWGCTAHTSQGCQNTHRAQLWCGNHCLVPLLPGKALCGL